MLRLRPSTFLMMNMMTLMLGDAGGEGCRGAGPLPQGVGEPRETVLGCSFAMGSDPLEMCFLSVGAPASHEHSLGPTPREE